MTLVQFGLVKVFLEENCESEQWSGMVMDGSALREVALTPDTVNLYHACDRIIKPATADLKCSFVELVAAGPQQPAWFVSHWFGEPVLDFVRCLTQHASDRGLAGGTPYWVCAYANNQWELDSAVTADPSESSFRKAMALSEGTLSIVDRKAVVYSRVWCVFEIHTAVVTFAGEGRSKYLFDIYTAIDVTHRLPSTDENVFDVVECEAVGITTGFTQLDSARGGHLNLTRKAFREKAFPTDLTCEALQVDVKRAKASMEADRRGILNFIAGLADLGAAPHDEHETYERLNAELRGKFAAGSWRSALERGEEMRSYEVALRNSRLQDLTFSFRQCGQLTDDALGALAGSLPEELQSLSLGLRFSAQFGDKGLASLGQGVPRKIQTLIVYAANCPGPTLAGLKEFLRPLSRDIKKFIFNTSLGPAEVESFRQAVATHFQRDARIVDQNDPGNKFYAVFSP